MMIVREWSSVFIDQEAYTTKTGEAGGGGECWELSDRRLTGN